MTNLKISTPRMTRRTLLAAGAVLPLFGIIGRASAAEFKYKYATGQDPTHPVNIRAKEALDRIREATNGRLDIGLFPANQLGSDTDLIAQVRSGAIEFLNIATSIFSTFVPAAGLTNTGFAFPDYDGVWKAMDGELGQYIATQVVKSGLVLPGKVWDNGFRHVTSSTRRIATPADIKGFKMRVPPAPMLTSLFQALNAGPAPINFNELYSALQTKVVEGQENPLAIFSTARLYEVQKYCSMTGHTWDGYLVIGNRRTWQNLPEDLREVFVRELNKSCLDQRKDIENLSNSLRQELTAKGIEFIDVDRDAFRAELQKTSYYADWKAKYGAEGWSRLEAAVGSLA